MYGKFQNLHKLFVNFIIIVIWTQIQFIHKFFYFNLCIQPICINMGCKGVSYKTYINFDKIQTID